MQFVQCGRIGFCLSSQDEPQSLRANDNIERLETRKGEVAAALMGSSNNPFELLYEDDIWIGDTGASNHSCKSKTGARNERSANSECLGHAGEAVKAQSVIDLHGQFVESEGTLGLEATLKDVQVSQKFNFNLLSITKLLRDGWDVVTGNAAGIVIEKNGNRIAFDIVVETTRGAIFACRFIRSVGEVAAVGTGAGKKMNVTKAHSLLGHVSEASTRQTAKGLGLEISRGSLKPCVHCARAKAKQKNVCKASEAPKSDIPGQRVYLDLSKVTLSRKDGSKDELHRQQWKIIVDEATGKKWCDFTTTKAGMVEPTCEFMNIMKSKGIPIRVIRMDPGGENVKLEKRLQTADWQGLQPIDCEFTSRNTPQHNSRAEVAFPYIANLTKAMMGAANVPEDIRRNVAIEALTCAVQLDGLTSVELKGKLASRDEHVYGCNPKWATPTQLRVWGEAGVVREGKDGKTGDRGTKMMFVGYPHNRESDCKRMFNPQTKRVVVTRDVIWMHEMYYKEPMGTGMEILGETSEEYQDEENGVESNYDDRDDEEEIPDLAVRVEDDEDSDDEDSVAEEDVTPLRATVTTRSGRSVRPSTRLIETMTTTMMTGSAAELRLMSARGEQDNIEIELAAFETEVSAEAAIELNLVGAGIGGGFDNTSELKVMNYQQAMSSENKEAWKVEVGNEKKRFDKYNAFTAVKESSLPANAKILSSTWAMKMKTNGTLRGRLNARGYQQQDGVHYLSDSISSPVTNPTAVRIGCTLMAMNKNWIAIVLDVEGAFLQGSFYNGEVLYMKVPDGFEEYYEPDEVLRMNVPIYGTKQASQCFYRTFKNGVKTKGYQRSKADPCMFFRWKDGRLVLFLVWIDDIVIFGTPADVKEVEENIKKIFVCKSEGALIEYVGSKIDITRKEDGLATVKFTQPALVQKLGDEYDVPEGLAPQTPASEGQVLVRGDGSGQLGPVDAKTYRSGVATMMFMMQWSRPEIYNSVRGMSRQMSEPREAHKQAMYAAMKYIRSTPNRGWCLNPTVGWDGSKDFAHRISGRSDSDYAANTDDRRSVSGGRTFLNECPIIVRSSTQKTVSLSVTESEGSAGVMVAQDMLFALRLLEALGLKVELPMLLEMDNMGAVHLANNWSVGGRTRHIDVRNHFLRELKEQGLLVIRYVKGDDNDSDIFTKNTSSKVFKRHIPKFVGTDEYMSSSSESLS